MRIFGCPTIGAGVSLDEGVVFSVTKSMVMMGAAAVAVATAVSVELDLGSEAGAARGCRNGAVSKARAIDCDAGKNLVLSDASSSCE